MSWRSNLSEQSDRAASPQSDSAAPDPSKEIAIALVKLFVDFSRRLNPK
jgi:hypothetical protein